MFISSYKEKAGPLFEDSDDLSGYRTFYCDYRLYAIPINMRGVAILTPRSLIFIRLQREQR